MRGKHIEITDETHTELKIYVARNRFKTFDQAIQRLLQNAD